MEVGGHRIHESDEDLRGRAGRIKEVIREYRKEYKTVAIVSHWWVITFLLGEGYDSNSFPKKSPDIINAKGQQQITFIRHGESLKNKAVKDFC